MEAPSPSEAVGPGSTQILQAFVASAIAEAIVVLTPAGTVCGWTKGARQLLGYEESEILGKPLNRIFTPEDQSKNIHLFELEVAAADFFAEDDRWHLRKDGSRVWVTGTLSAVRDSADNLIGFVKVMRDRTDLRTRLERLEIDNASLREQAGRTDLFLHTLGHELRNPLGPLSMVTKLLRANENAKTQAVQVIDRQVAVLKGLADDLMDIARSAHAGFELNFERIHLQKLLLNAVSDLQEAADNKKIELTALLQDGPIYIDADPRRLLQVILNLLGNALKYTPSGGKIFLKAVESAGDVVIHVEDNGMGISAETLPKIFEFFTQDADARKAVPGGLGVGLALVRQIVEQHRGSVGARSAGLGKGSEFSVRLPLEREAASS
jgi:PAS domain S-box-containing protein